MAATVDVKTFGDVKDTLVQLSGQILKDIDFLMRTARELKAKKATEIPIFISEQDYFNETGQNLRALVGGIVGQRVHSDIQFTQTSNGVWGVSLPKEGLTPNFVKNTIRAAYIAKMRDLIPHIARLTQRKIKPQEALALANRELVRAQGRFADAEKKAAADPAHAVRILEEANKRLANAREAHLRAVSDIENRNISQTVIINSAFTQLLGSNGGNSFGPVKWLCKAADIKKGVRNNAWNLQLAAEGLLQTVPDNAQAQTYTINRRIDNQFVPLTLNGVGNLAQTLLTNGILGRNYVSSGEVLSLIHTFFAINGLRGREADPQIINARDTAWTNTVGNLLGGLQRDAAGRASQAQFVVNQNGQQTAYQLGPNVDPSFFHVDDLLSMRPRLIVMNKSTAQALEKNGYNAGALKPEQQEIYARFLADPAVTGAAGGPQKVLTDYLVNISDPSKKKREAQGNGKFKYVPKYDPNQRAAMTQFRDAARKQRRTVSVATETRRYCVTEAIRKLQSQQ